MKKLSIIILMMVFGLTSLSFACAPNQGKHSKGRHPHVKKVAFYKKHLDLNETQLTKLEAINAKFKLKHDDISASIRPLKERVRTLKMKDNPDFREIRQTLRELSPLHLDMQMAFIKQHDEIKQILSKKQRAKLKKLKKKKRGKHKRHGHG